MYDVIHFLHGKGTFRETFSKCDALLGRFVFSWFQSTSAPSTHPQRENVSSFFGSSGLVVSLGAVVLVLPLPLPLPLLLLLLLLLLIFLLLAVLVVLAFRVAVLLFAFLSCCPLGATTWITARREGGPDISKNLSWDSAWQCLCLWGSDSVLWFGVKENAKDLVLFDVGT